MVDAAVLAAGVHHHADILLAHLLLRLVGVDADEPQHTVGGHGQQPDDGREQLRDHHHQPGDAQRHLFRLLHGDALGYQLAEHQREVGQDQGDQYDHQRVQRGGRNGHAQPDEPIHQRVGEVLRRECAAQKARQRNGDLNGGQKFRRLRRQLAEALRLPVAVGAHFIELDLVHRQHGDLRAGKNGVEENKHHL